MVGRGDFVLTLGVRDWLRPDWVSGFYPADLPPEWRLGYYGNAFRAVLVPVGRWRTAGPAVWADWAQEVLPDFRFYLEWDGDCVRDSTAAQAAQILGPRFGGWVVASGVPPPPEGMCAVAGGTGAARLWEGEGTPGHCAGVGRLACGAPPDPRALRQALEGFMARSGARRGVLFLDAPPAVLEQARIVAELLGVT